MDTAFLSNCNKPAWLNRSKKRCENADQLFRKLEPIDRDLAQYVVPLAYRMRFYQWQNFRQLFWETELRTVSQGHPDYRFIEQEKYRLVKEKFPLIASFMLVDMNDYADRAPRDGGTDSREREEVDREIEGKDVTGKGKEHKKHKMHKLLLCLLCFLCSFPLLRVRAMLPSAPSSSLRVCSSPTLTRDSDSGPERLLRVMGRPSFWYSWPSWKYVAT